MTSAASTPRARAGVGELDLISPDKSAVRKIFDQARAAKRQALTAPEARCVCEAYGIKLPAQGVASTAEGAVTLAITIGFPVVMKIVSPEILHKTEAGGVMVASRPPREVAEGLRDHHRQRPKYNAKAKIDGVQVQQMLGGGQEVIVGAVTDPAVRQAGGLRPRRRSGRGAEGHHLPPGARDQARRAVDARRHCRPPRCCKGVRGGDAGRPRGARRASSQASRSSSATSRRSPRWI